MMLHLVYQAYGKAEILEQTLFSIVSLLNISERVRPVVYTDTPDYFQRFMESDERLTIVPITAADIQRWRGTIQFVHRVKIEILADAAERFKENIYYADGDTYFLNDPALLFDRVDPGTSLMHLPEAELGRPTDPLTKKIYKFVKSRAFTVDDEHLHMGPETVMWNAGVIGLHSSQTILLRKILALTDAMYAQYPKHVMEQLAVSYLLQTHTQILRADSAIYHYWDQKDAYQKMIHDFFEANGTLKSALSNYVNVAFPAPQKKQIRASGWIRSLFSR